MANLNLAAARAVKPHLYAVAILAQADMEWESGTVWSVFVAELPQSKLQAQPEQAESWSLDGKKSWCSLANVIDRAVADAHIPAGRLPFAFDMNQRDFEFLDEPWISRGLSRVETGTVRFTDTAAVPVTDISTDRGVRTYPWSKLRPTVPWAASHQSALTRMWI